jgi:hypothetical protein
MIGRIGPGDPEAGSNSASGNWLWAIPCLKRRQNRCAGQGRPGGMTWPGWGIASANWLRMTRCAVG